VLVVDAAGMGKTTLSKYVFLSALSERKVLPIFVNLRRLTSGSSIQTFIGTELGLSDDSLPTFSNFLSTQRLLFIFDGLDEIVDSVRAECEHELRRFVDRSKNSLFFFTSRPDSVFSGLSEFRRFGIVPLNPNEAFELIRKYGIATNRDPTSLIKEIESLTDESISSYLENPLLTSLLFRAYQYKSVLPLKKSGFYKQVFEALFESHDLSKEQGFSRRKSTELHLDEMHRVLRALSAGFAKYDAVEVSVEEFEKILGDVRSSWLSDLTFNGADLKRDLTLAVPVLAEDGLYIRWAHRSLQEYFFAEFLSRDYQADLATTIGKFSRGSSAFRYINMLSIFGEIEPIRVCNLNCVTAL
jgi:hypothetical protein